MIPMNRANTRKSSEHNEQATFIDHVLWTYRNREDFIRNLFFAVPNGAWLGGRAKNVMNKLKGEGFLPGVSDLLYLQPRGTYPYLAIEMKSPSRRNHKDGGLEESQIAFLKAANDAGALALVCYGADEAIERFDNYMTLMVRKSC